MIIYNITMNILDLPPELLLHITSFVDYNTITTLTKTNSYFRDVIKHNIDSIVSCLFNSNNKSSYYWINYFDYGKGYDIFIKISKILTRLFTQPHLLYYISDINIFYDNIINLILLGSTYWTAYRVSNNFSSSKINKMKKLLKEGFNSEYCYNVIGTYYLTENQINNMILLKKANFSDDYCYFVPYDDNIVEQLIELLNEKFNSMIALDAVKTLSTKQIKSMKKLKTIGFIENYCFELARTLNHKDIDNIIYIKTTYSGFTDEFYSNIAKENINEIYIEYAVKLKNCGYYQDNEIELYQTITHLTPKQLDNIILLKEYNFDNYSSKQGGILLNADQIIIAKNLKDIGFKCIECIKGSQLTEDKRKMMLKFKEDMIDVFDYTEILEYSKQELNSLYYLQRKGFTSYEYTKKAINNKFTQKQLDIMISIKNQEYHDIVSYLCARLNNNKKIKKFIKLISSDLFSELHIKKCYNIMKR